MPADPASPAVILERLGVHDAERAVSARSLLVTLLGDSIAPLGGSIWLSDLISLGESLGFSQRLVRTSVFRLTNEHWVIGERTGRRSRYSLATEGAAEISAVNDRIYGLMHVEQESDEWLLVFTSVGAVSPVSPTTDIAPGMSTPVQAADDLIHHLRWLGFAEIGPSVWGRPDAKPDLVHEVAGRLGLTSLPVLALARFEDVGRLVNSASFRETSGLAEVELQYRAFVDRFAELDQRVASGDVSALLADPETAFVLRTLLIHDFRRVRLTDPELPTALLGDDWIGAQARDVAARLYRAVEAASWEWLFEVTGLRPQSSHPAVTSRFPDLLPVRR